MCLDAARSITSAAFSASAWLSMPQQSMSSLLFLAAEGFHLAAEVLNRHVSYALLRRTMPGTHAPLPPVTDRGPLLLLPGRAHTLPQTVSLYGTASGAGYGSLQLCVWRVGDLCGYSGFVATWSSIQRSVTHCRRSNR